MDTNQEFLTQIECDELAVLMNRKHESFRGERSFSVKASQDGGSATVTVTLHNDDETFFYPVEARVDWVQEEMLHRQAALFLIDYIDLYFEDFLDSGEDLFLPIDWAPFDYEGVPFQLRGQIVNQMAVSLADKLLADFPVPPSTESAEY